MGSGASVALTEEQKTVVTKNLRKVYEENISRCQNNVELQTILTQAFKEAVTTSSSSNGTSESKAVSGSSDTATAAPKISTLSAKYRQKSLKINTNEEGSSLKKSSNRRRSFDINGSFPLVEKADPTEEINEMIASTNEALAPPTTTTNKAVATIDSWDSVTTQPYCEICQMAFKTNALYSRHLRYSKSHIEKAKLTEGSLLITSKSLDAGLAAPNGNMSTQPSPSPTSSSTPTAGFNTTVVEEDTTAQQYRLLYSGAKFYWRLQVTIDYDIYHHFATTATTTATTGGAQTAADNNSTTTGGGRQTIEIIPHHNNKQRELSRLYLDYNLCLEQPVIAMAVDEEIERRLKSPILAAKGVTISLGSIEYEVMKNEVIVQKIATFLLSRLMYQPPSSETMIGEGGAGAAAPSLLPGLDLILPVPSSPSNNSSSNSNSNNNYGTVYLTKLQQDDFPEGFLLSEPPLSLKPFNVTRRRRSSAGEVDYERLRKFSSNNGDRGSTPTGSNSNNSNNNSNINSNRDSNNNKYSMGIHASIDEEDPHHQDSPSPVKAAMKMMATSASAPGNLLATQEEGVER